MHEGMRRKGIDTFTASAALYQTLFNLQTTPPNLNNAIHVDTLKNFRFHEDQKLPNIMATFDYVNLIGWKFKEG